MSMLIGVGGGSGSGKTTVTRALVADYPPDQVQVVPLDAYYLDRRDMTPEERTRINYDHPEAYDTPLLLEHLRALKSGVGVDQPTYDYAEHLRGAETIPIEPARVVVLEGILVLALDAVRPLIDLSLFVDTESDLRFLRRLRRDVAERGRTIESVMQQYIETVRPMHHAYIEPSKHHADLILPGEGSYDAAVEVVRAWISARAT